MKDTPRKGDQPNIAVINADDPSAPVLTQASVGADYLLLYSVHNSDADFYADRIHYGPDFTSFMLRGNAGDIPIRSPLPGEYNIANMLAGIAGAVSAMPQLHHQQRMVSAIPRAISQLEQIPGRMERIHEGQPFLAIVDFAHTPDALDKALTAARKLVRPNGKLIAVFGSAGLRDREKRRMMAEVSAQLADISVLTAEDPRTESLLKILDEMKQGALNYGVVENETVFLIPDRGRAIYEACQMAQPDDVVIICGKGHEQSMCFGTIEHPWDDRAATRAALQGQPLLNLPSAELPYDTTEPWLND
jgi:UDP-N-acetylmuramoyl-L-alanyl-D-glutamate--2,6-diaminopimelate ligase